MESGWEFGGGDWDWDWGGGGTLVFACTPTTVMIAPTKTMYLCGARRGG